MQIKLVALSVLTLCLFFLSCSGGDDAPDKEDTSVIPDINWTFDWGTPTDTVPMDTVSDMVVDLETSASEVVEIGQETTPNDVCQPSCDGKECGDDGCGGSCGDCSEGGTCIAGTCCLPACDGKECGDDGCGGSCGECADGGECLDGTCCVPSCDGKDCGDDGCDGSCGSCLGGEVCDGGACIAESCLDITCPGGATCDPATGDCLHADCGLCPPSMDCPAGGPSCIGPQCGDVDEEGACDGTTLHRCVDGELFLTNCDVALGDGFFCDWDPTASAYGCVETACGLDCTDKECGPDGCGGSCGACSGADVCVDGGQCCTPVCTGKLCGDDGCGGSCGTCGGGSVCSPLGICCIPQCAGKECGDDSCGGVCGDCGAQGVCIGGYCCVYQCNGKDCGPDGCGGTCGTCADTAMCISGVCCEASCEGKECGSDGCNGTCGSCTWPQICYEGSCCSSSCVGKECGGDGCGGSCGECADGGVCLDGTCCTPACDGLDCGDDGCGGVCGECAQDSLCLDGICCTPDCAGKECGEDGCGDTCGTCADGSICLDGACCAPQCEGIECGADGCGGSCGACPDGWACLDGTCCEQSCEGKECGDDGCGTSCGTCPSWATCNERGFCVDECLGGCALSECGVSPCGEYCGECASTATCVDGVCVDACVPSCAGKKCGDDGCGGDCGTCADGEYCVGNDCVTTCSPSCDGKECGDDGCGGTCGTCAEGIACAAPFLCGSECATCDGGPECATIGFEDGTLRGFRLPLEGFVTTSLFGITPPTGGAMAVLATQGLAPSGQATLVYDTCVDPGTTSLQVTASVLSEELVDACGSGTADVITISLETVHGVTEVLHLTTDDLCDPSSCDGCGGSYADLEEATGYTADAALQTGWVTLQLALGTLVAEASGVVTLHVTLTDGGSGDGATWLLIDELALYDCGGPACDGLDCGPDGCGGTCGTCDEGYLCGEGQTCECIPDCAGSECGDDSCGGSCGECGLDQVCHEGACCMPDCDYKACGDDGCGGSCGTCSNGFVCQPSVGQCCYPMCTGKECGDDGCEGTCGTCPQGPCVDGLCVCEPACDGKECGPDGCGGECGTCAGDAICTEDGLCCDLLCADRECGTDGCGGSCGTCDEGVDCTDDFQCGNQCTACSYDALCYAPLPPEVPSFDGWVTDGTAWVADIHGTTLPVKGSYMAILSTGPEEVVDSSTISFQDCLPAGLTSIDVIWKVVSEELLESCGSSFQDTFVLELVGDTTMEIARVTIDDLCPASACDGCGSLGVSLAPSMIDLGDSDTWETDWIVSTFALDPAFQLAGGSFTLVATVQDGGDTAWDTEVIINHVKLYECAADCAGKECGPDGCGGVCGTCAGGLPCEVDGTCCQPDCDGKVCGDDGCGGSCGDCADGAPCTPLGLCCEPFCGIATCGDDGCGGSCGDCAIDETCILGTCSADASCQGITYEGCCVDGALKWCEGGTIFQESCGSVDSCGWDDGLALYRCGVDALQDPTGTFPLPCPGTCDPSCDGKECGSDGCWGSCGTCGDGLVCDPDGLCCEPQCNDAECGSDGCGGSCGTCADGETCHAGHCFDGCGEVTSDGCCKDGLALRCESAALVVDDCSTVPSCGWSAGNGYYTCGTTGIEEPTGTHPKDCPWVCIPDCDGKVCGSNGCYGDCGSCDAGFLCSSAGSCIPLPQDTCATAQYILPSDLPLIVEGTTVGALDDYELPATSCPGDLPAEAWGAGAPDITYRFTPNTTAEYRISLDPFGFDAAVYLVTDCGDLGGTCKGADTFVEGPSTTFITLLQAGQVYYLVVDGVATDDAGSFVMSMAKN